MPQKVARRAVGFVCFVGFGFQMLSLSFIFFSLGYIISSIVPPFLNKMSVRAVPLPFLFAAIRTTFGLAIVGFLLWRARSPISLIPPRSIIPTLSLALFGYGVFCVFHSYGTFVSSVDFRLLFRMSGLFWNALLGFAFLGERIGLFGTIPLLLVLFGLFLSMYDFQWSTELLCSKYQTIGLILELIIESTVSLLIKRAATAVKGSSFSHDCVIFYQYSIALLAYAISAVVHEWSAFGRLGEMVTTRLIAVVLLSGILGSTAHLMYQYLHSEATMLNLGFVRLIRYLCCLVSSHFVFTETNWNLRQMQNAKPKQKAG
jgi:drug/metabolite transporter (DMT)-like permease